MADRYKNEGLLTVEEALEQVLACVNVLGSEQVGMLDAIGRVLAKDICSDIDISPFNNSGMDGFAVKALDTEGATEEQPIRLKIIGEIAAGEVFEGEVKSGEAVRIMTGASMPDSVDAVIKIEDVVVHGESAQTPEGTEVEISAKIAVKKNVRPKGEDALAGEVLLKAGTTLHPAGIGLLAATGNSQVDVVRRPRVAVLSTGDELVGPTAVPGPGQIRNTNCYSLAAAAKAAGAEVAILGIVRDDYELICKTIVDAVSGYDIVMISGGAAEGDFDYSYQVIDSLGEVLFNKVNMRPGKAQTLGIINETVVFGLPGNPAAAMIGFEVLMRPALRKMQGFSKIMRPLTRARLTADVRKPDFRRFFVRARLVHDIATDEYSVTPETNQSSALLGPLQNSNCLVVLPEGLIGNVEGETVGCLRLDVNEGVII